MGGGRGGGHASKALLSLSGQELERGKYGGGPVVVVLARIGVAVPEPCRCCPPSSLRSLHLRCISCHAGDVGVALAHASRVGGPGQNGSRLGPSSTETLLQFPQNPPAKRAGAIHDAVANSEEHGSMESWEASHGCRRGWHPGRLETRQSHGFKISRLNLAGPCRRLGGLGCCPALRLLGAPFPDPSSTTTHTTHAHGTRRTIHPPSTSDPGSSLGRPSGSQPLGLSFLDGDRRLRPRGCHTLVVRSRRRRVREQGCSAVLRLADGGVPWTGDGPSGINRSTTSTVFPPVCRPLMISGACRRLLPVPPRRVMPDRDITAPQSLAQAHWLARDRHGPHGCLSSKNNRGTLQDHKKYTLQHGAPASAWPTTRRPSTKHTTHARPDGLLDMDVGHFLICCVPACSSVASH